MVLFYINVETTVLEDGPLREPHPIVEVHVFNKEGHLVPSRPEIISEESTRLEPQKIVRKERKFDIDAFNEPLNKSDNEPKP